MFSSLFSGNLGAVQLSAWSFPTETSEQILELLQFCCGDHESLPSERRKVVVGSERRILETRPNFFAGRSRTVQGRAQANCTKIHQDAGFQFRKARVIPLESPSDTESRSHCIFRRWLPREHDGHSGREAREMGSMACSLSRGNRASLGPSVSASVQWRRGSYPVLCASGPRSTRGGCPPTI